MLVALELIRKTSFGKYAIGIAYMWTIFKMIDTFKSAFNEKLGSEIFLFAILSFKKLFGLDIQAVPKSEL